MGNCCSTTDIKTSKTPCIPPPSKSPPQPLEEETVVKEVVTESETRSIIPRSRIINPSPFIRSAPLLSHPHKPFKHNDELSEEISEICSSLSASTKNDDFHEVRQRSPAKIRNRSFSGELKRDRISPGRRTTDPSPRRVRAGDGIVMRKDNGESSRRRSRSPVTRVDMGSCKPGLDRSQSARKTGKSPSRVGSGLGCERIRKDNWPPPTTTTTTTSSNNESLDNPLVSLECFIFL